MLYKENLEDLIFTRHEDFDVDQLVIVSGYIGPNPIKKLNSIPLKCSVVYGMYGERNCVNSALHKQVLNHQSFYNNINIYYSKSAVHAKAYIWLLDQKPVTALIGSANFSIKGLNTPWREILSDADNEAIFKLNEYKNRIIEDSLLCNSDDVAICTGKAKDIEDEIFDPSICKMTLLDPRTNETHLGHGLNWGHSVGSHVNIDDASIPIRSNHVKNYPDFFPQKQSTFSQEIEGGRQHRHNDPIEIMWDDGTLMQGLLEGNRRNLPKQISSFPKKNIIGIYFRERLGLSKGEFITKKHLESYGRTDISVSLVEDGIYYFDFSV